MTLMLFISVASETTVLEAFAAGRNPAEGSGPWTTRFIRQATKQFDERWSLVEITGAEARAIVVPPHSGEPCRGDRMELVPPGGLSVESTARALEVCRDAYAAANRTCWSRIAQAIDDPAWSEIILTRAPLALDDYATVTGGAGLYHLDGFHRLVGWTLAGRLMDEVRIRAFLAG